MKYLVMLVEKFPHQIFPEKAKVFNQEIKFEKYIRIKFEKSLQIYTNTAGKLFSISIYK